MSLIRMTLECRLRCLIGASVLFAGLSGCATEIERHQVHLVPASAQESMARLALRAPVHVESTSGYGRDLPTGSTWEFRGIIDQGRVYRRADGILTVEGAQVHEAYIVMSAGKIVGFYLPVEQAFSPARESVAAGLE